MGHASEHLDRKPETTVALPEIRTEIGGGGSKARTIPESDVLTTSHAAPEKIGVINGLRGLALFGVLVFHLLRERVPPGASPFRVGGFPLSPWTLLTNGWFGVNLFFVLSGFVLYLPYATNRRVLHSWADVNWFYRRRFQRLLPLYYISTLLIEILAHRPDVSDPAFWRYAAVMATATFNFFSSTYYTQTNFVLWSLGLEIWFSILFPILVMAIGRWGLGRVALVVLLAALETRLYGTHVATPYTYGNWLKDSLLGRLDDFVAGMVVCRAFVAGAESTGRVPWRTCFITGLALLFAGGWGWDLDRLGHTPRAAEAVFNNLVNIGFSLILLAAVSSPGCLVTSFLRCRLLQWAGLICYSFYIWHGVAIVALLPEDEVIGPRLVGYLVLTTALSALTYRYIEFGREPDARKLFRVSE